MKAFKGVFIAALIVLAPLARATDAPLPGPTKGPGGTVTTMDIQTPCPSCG